MQNYPQPTQTTRKQIVLVTMMFTGAMLIAGFIGFFGGAVMLRDYVESRNWVSTSGTVADHNIREVRSRRSRTYSATIYYDYQVNGQPYRYSRLSSDQGFCVLVGCTPSLNFATFGGAEGHLAKYPIGQAVTVIYDPSDPQRAFLERRFPAIPFAIWLGGLMLGLIGGGFFIRYGLEYDRLQVAERVT